VSTPPLVAFDTRDGCTAREAAATPAAADGFASVFGVDGLICTPPDPDADTFDDAEFVAL
jgi:hypothetical protein